MLKFVIAFILGMSIGYAYGYQQGDTGQPSILQKVVGKMSGQAYKVKAEQEGREKALDSATAPLPAPR
jgi:hypothetical protein